MQVTTFGIDLAKSVFQVHGVYATGGVSVKKKLRRAEVLAFFKSLPPCLVGMEACATAHFWAREIGALGHEVRLMPPSYVKAYVRRQKNDAADAAAICEAVTRPTMRLVAVKSAERQGVLVPHRTRELLVRQRTMLINAVRGHCAEFGIVAARGAVRVAELIEQVRRAETSLLPDLARSAILMLGEQLDALQLGSTASNGVCWPGTGKMRPASVWQRSLGLASSPRRPWLRRSPIPAPSAPAGNSPPSWGWCHARTRPGARTGSGASPRWVIAISGSSWSWARPRSCAGRAPAPRRPRPGSELSSNVVRRAWSPSPWPTRPPGSPPAPPNYHPTSLSGDRRCSRL